MIRTAWCAFALGAWMLQQAAALPGDLHCLIYLGACAALALAAHCAQRRTQRVRGYGARWLTQLALVGLALSAGFGWAEWRAQLRLAYALPAEIEGRDVRVSGHIVGVPEPFAQGMRFAFEVGSVINVTKSEKDPVAKVDFDHFPRKILLSWYRPAPQLAQQLQPGRQWQLTVRLRRVHGSANPGGFDTERGMLERDIRASGQVREMPAPVAAELARGWQPSAALAALDRWRMRTRERIEAGLPGAPHAGVVVALAIGMQAAIAHDDWQRFTGTGTNHLVAISGLHVSLVAGLLAVCATALWRAAARLGLPLPLILPAQHAAVLAAILGGGLYVALAGFGVPAQRAWWMLLVAALARLGGCQTGVSTVLAWALGIVVAIDPWAVASPGFEMSFGAVGALVLASSRMVRDESPRRRDERASKRDRSGVQPKLDVSCTAGETSAQPRLRQPGSVGLFLQTCWRRLVDLLNLHGALTLALLPLGVAWFALVPLLAVPANLLAIPWVSFFVTPAVLLGVVLPAPLDAWALHAAHAGLSGLAAYLDVLCAPRWIWRVPFPKPLHFALAALGVLWWLMPRGWPLRRWAACLWLPLLWPASSAPAAGEFRMTVLDVGQGGATLVETAHHRLLFDTGTGPTTGDAGARVVVPYLQGRGFVSLDMLVISHGDSDHAAGAPAVMQALRVGVLRASLPPAHGLWTQAQTSGVADRAPCHAAQHWQWDGVTFAFLWPAAAPDASAPNQTACVLRISNASHAALLTADIEAPAEQALIAQVAAAQAGQLRADILLAPHHGSLSSSTPDFLDAIVPRHVVFQVGYRNRFHHPHQRVVARYAARGAVTYRSDRDGAVQFETAAQTLEVQRYRTTHRRYWMDR